MSTNESSDDVA